jgi:ABC-type branched-subunit amino acid transport system ATPase component
MTPFEGAQVAERPGDTGNDTLLLRVRGIDVEFGGVKALDDVCVEVFAGHIHGLIGPNGAGKTTLMDVISGFLRPARGTVELGDTRVERRSVHRRARHGLGRTFQALELFDDLTVRDNLSVGLVSGSKPSDEDVAHAAELLGIEHELDRLVVELPHGRRRLASVARAIVGRPTVLLLDEPAAGLESRETAELGEVLRSLVTPTTAVVLVEHDMQLVMDVCDRVSVLQLGKVIAHGTPAEIRNDPLVRAAYLGES